MSKKTNRESGWSSLIFFKTSHSAKIFIPLPFGGGIFLFCEAKGGNVGADRKGS